MKTLRWILPFYFLFMIATSVFAQDPESIFTDYFDKILNHENSSAYSLISAEDKKIVSKDDFERSPWPFINQDIFYQYLDKFSIEIVNSEVKDDKAYVTYRFIGPINLIMQTWDELSEENMKRIRNGGNSNFNSPTEFQRLLEARIKKSMANNNYSLEEKIRTIELIKENNAWKLHLNLISLKNLRKALKIISRVDTKLGYSKYGEINLDDHNPDEKHRIYQEALNNYIRANDIIGSLCFVSEDDINNKKYYVRMVQDKIDKLRIKMSEELEMQKPKSQL